MVGKTHVTETPEFDGTVSYMVVNPSWHIPDSIAIRDYLPKLQRNPMVLKNQGIDLMTRAGTVINPKLVDFTQYTPENFPFRIKQRPSDDNALGQSSSCSRTASRSTCTTRRTASSSRATCAPSPTAASG